MLSENEVAEAPKQGMAFKLHIDRYRTSRPKEVYKNLLSDSDPPPSIKHVLPIIEIMLTISVSTAIVERGFSHMNNIKSSTRSNLGKERKIDKVYIHIYNYIG